VWDGRDIRNQIDPNTKGGKSTNRRFATRARALDTDVKILDTLLLRGSTCHLGRNLCGKRSALSRTLETLTPARCPSQSAPLAIGDGNDRVVEGRMHMGDSIRHVFSDFLSHTLCGCIRYLSHKIFSSTKAITCLQQACSTLLFHYRTRLAGPLACTSIRLGPLTTNWEPATVTKPTIATQIHQSFDVD
jgi:hypothetical protein